MQFARQRALIFNQVRFGETAALESAAAGFRDALAAQCVYAAILSEDGLLRFKASAPTGAGSPGPIQPSAVPGLAVAVNTGLVTDLEDARPPFAGEGRVVAIPWTAAGEVLGVGVVVMPEGLELPGDGVLALLGAKVGSTIAALRDCDALVHRVAELHDSAEVLDRVVDAASDSMKLIDLEGHILRWNRASEELYGWSEAEVIGGKMPHVPEDLRLRAIHDIRSIAASGRTVQRESAALRKDGSPIRVQVTVIPFVDGEGDPAGVLSISTGVTPPDSEPASMQLSALRADSLTAPLTSLVGYAQLLLHADILDDPVRRKRTIRAIEEHTATILSLMDDVALISTAGGTESLDLETTDVSALVTDVVCRFEQDRGSSYRLVVDYGSNVGPVMLDRRRMARAMRNVLASILEGIPEGAELRLGLSALGGGVCLELSTDRIAGVGPVEPGYGTLGLHVAQTIIEAHGGSLSAGDSDSTFAFRIVLPGDPG